MGYYTYDTYGVDGDAGFAIAVLSTYGIAFAVFIIFYMVSYILRGIGMYTMGKRMGMENSWLAFIPFGRAYFHGELAGAIKLKEKAIKTPGIWLVTMPIIGGAVHFIFYSILSIIGVAEMFLQASERQAQGGPVVGSGLVLAMVATFVIWVVVAIVYDGLYKVLNVLVNRHIFDRFTAPNMAIVHGVLCAILPLYEAVCFLVFRNKPFNEGMNPNAGASFRQPAPPSIIVPPSSEAESLQEEGSLQKMQQEPLQQEQEPLQEMQQNPIKEQALPKDEFDI